MFTNLNNRAWLPISTLAVLFFAFAPPAPAAIVLTGEVTPADPEGWLTRTSAKSYVGETAGNSGSVTISGASQAESTLCYLGFEAGATGTATVRGWSAEWVNHGSLCIGYGGEGELRVEGGATLTDQDGYLGYEPGSVGVATVTGSGSTWQQWSDLYVGYEGSGSLTVENGGEVIADTLFASVADLHGDGTINATKGAVLDADLRFDAAHPTETTVPFGSGGTLTVNGSEDDLGAGYCGNGTLTVAQGVSVTSTYGYLGYRDGAYGEATVTGTGSKWTTDRLFVGYEGSGTLTVENGGRVVTQSLYAAPDDLHGNGTITAGGAVLDVDLRFDAAHGAQNVFAFGNGGTLTVAPGEGKLGAGFRGDGSLIVADGVAIESKGGHLGFHEGSNGTASVSGAGSKWTCTQSLYVGYGGSAGLTIENGGELRTSSVYLGREVGSSGQITVSGAGSKWTDTNILYVGEKGNGTLTVKDGATVNGTLAIVGSYATSTGRIEVSGSGSQFILTHPYSPSLLMIGGGDGSLCVSDGGLIHSGLTHLYGTAVVSGEQSVWLNTDDLRVGGGSSLTVSDGACVAAKTLIASLEDIHGDGTITAAGALMDADFRFDAAHPTSNTLAFGDGGTLLLNPGSGMLGVGYYGDGTLTVAEGACITSEEGILGNFSGSHGVATVTGPGSQWTTSGPLNVGSNGKGTLTIAAGGRIDSDEGLIGASSEGNGAAMVSGADSLWTVSNGLYVGDSGSGELILQNGGDVNSRFGRLGNEPGGTGAATVSGPGSKWTNSSSLCVGYEGIGRLVVEAGAEVGSYYGCMGDEVGSSGVVIVRGPGAIWTNRGNLSVGLAGHGTLLIEDGGEVSNSQGDIGDYTGSNGSVVVCGLGSKWTNRNRLAVGDRGVGTVAVAAGGTVWANSVSVNSQSLLSIDIGYDSRLTVDDGTGSLDNDGIVRLTAGPLATAGSEHSPVAAGTWTGDGVYQALGGTWNETTHVFTVSETCSGLSGQTLTIDLSDCRRALIEDPITGRTAGVSFLAKTGSGNAFDLTATALTPVEIVDLDGSSRPEGLLIGGWDFTAAGSGYDPKTRSTYPLRSPPIWTATAFRSGATTEPHGPTLIPST